MLSLQITNLLLHNWHIILMLLQPLFSPGIVLRVRASPVCRLVVESQLYTGRRKDEVGSRTENTTCPRQLSHCTWLLIIFFCYLLQSHLLVEETPLCFSKFAQNPLFTILFKHFARTACTHKVNHVLPSSQEQGQMSARKDEEATGVLILGWTEILSNSQG